MRRSTHIALGALVGALATGGLAIADSMNMIGSPLIRDDSVRSRDVHDGTLRCRDLSDNMCRLARRDRVASGQPGPQGPKGDPGDTGPAGPPGLPGQSLVADRLTPVNPTYSGGGNEVRVVDVPALAVGSGGPGAGEGASLFPAVALDAGTYVVHGAVQAFDFAGVAAETEYGVARVFLDGQPVGTLWTSDVPDDGNNAAMASATSVVVAPAGGGSLTVEGAMRSAEGDGGQMGGNLIVTAVDP